VFERSGFQFAEAAPDGKGFRPLRSARTAAPAAGAATAAAAQAAGGGEGGGGEEGVAVDGDGDGGAGSGDLYMSAVPYSKGVQFGEEEVAEMVEALAAGEGRRDAVRPNK